jgi:tetratricopeptide (TPR) repeat protein
MMRQARLIGPLAAALLVTANATSAPVQARPEREHVAGSLERLASCERELRTDPGSLRKGAAYRQEAIATGQYDRAIGLTRDLAKRHPDLIEAQVNAALACIDKVPVSGKVRQALLGRDALDWLTRAIALRPTGLAYYCRGLVNLFYDALIFRRVPIGVADLQKALAIQRAEEPRAYHARTYISLGDGYWKLKDLLAARRTWEEGAARFPGDRELRERLTLRGKALEWKVRGALDPDHRVDTSLAEILDDLPRYGLR